MLKESGAAATSYLQLESNYKYTDIPKADSKP